MLFHTYLLDSNTACTVCLLIQNSPFDSPGQMERFIKPLYHRCNTSKSAARLVVASCISFSFSSGAFEGQLEVGKRIEILELEIKLPCMVKFRRDF